MKCSVHNTSVVTTIYFQIINIYTYPHNDTGKILDIAKKSKSVNEQSLLI